MSAPSFDERSRRRPTFDPDSVPATFGGAVLYLPRPRVVLRRRREPGGASRAEVCHGFGADFDALVDRVEAASGGTMVELATALIDLAADLVARNYDLAEAELDELLVLDPSGFGGDSIPEPWATVWGMACSVPKSSGAGPAPPASSAASTPTA